MTDIEAYEAAIQEACRTGRHDAAAGLIVQHYGPGVFAYLLDRLRSRTMADDVFACFTEHVLQGIATFAWRGTARSWAYSVARNASIDYLRRPDQRAAHRLLLDAPEVSAIAAQVRTLTAPYLRTDVKSRFRALRQQLSEEDQMLLILRLDRSFSWEEIAAVTLADGATDETAIQTEARRLRQRFKRAKEKLRELAIAEGLLDEPD